MRAVHSPLPLLCLFAADCAHAIALKPSEVNTVQVRAQTRSECTPSTPTMLRVRAPTPIDRDTSNGVA